MSTAREQAREAVRHSTGHDELADAASDVWEPILSDLVKAIKAAPIQHSWLMDDPAYKAAEEALA